MTTQINTPTENDNKLTKRVAQLFGVSAVPATLISALGDFLGPKGGWIFVGALGVLAITVAAYVLFTLLTMDKEKAPFWYRITSGDKDLSWAWSSKPAVLAHGLHVIVLFGVVCLFFAGKTFASLKSGGVLGKNIDAVAAAQKQLGLTQILIQEQKKTNLELNQLNQKASNFKKENSDNPRKELANMGLFWSSDTFFKSIQQSDLQAVNLFLSGGMPIGVGDVLSAVSARRKSDDIVKMIAQYAHQFDNSRCASLFDQLQSEAIEAASNPVKMLFKNLCGQPTNFGYVSAAVDRASVTIDQEKKRRSKEENDIKSPKACLEAEFDRNGEKLMNEASKFSLTSKNTYEKRDELIADIHIRLVTGRIDSSQIKSLVESYCAAQAAPPSKSPIDMSQLKKWNALRDWLV